MSVKKSIGIIAAMDVEVLSIINLMSKVKTETIGLSKFYSGVINGIDCVIAVSGVGKVCSAACTQAMIIKYNPQKILNIGIAGSLSENIRIHDIVVASSVVQYDMDLSAMGRPIGLIPGLNIKNIPCAVDLREKIMLCAENINETDVHTGVIATGDRFVADKDFKNSLIKNFNAVACEMEGGSIGQVCYMNNVEFAVIRKISDNAQEDSIVSYQEFEKTACEKMCDLIICFLKKMS